MSAIPSPVVIKVGGSLYNRPDLRERLNAWLNCEVTEPALLVPGGGPFVETLRDLDAKQKLGEEAAHWLALRMLALNAHFLLQLLPDAVLVSDLESCTCVWRRNLLGVLDALAFAQSDDGCHGSLPHTWEITSDSIAARAARLLGARNLILLKSADDPTQGDWVEAGRRGYVDPYFARAIGNEFSVKAVNLREWQPKAGRMPDPRLSGEHDPSR
jgi:aspartokinase-like uncharacterized kinase